MAPKCLPNNVLRFNEMFEQIHDYHIILGQREIFATPEQQMQQVRNFSLALMMELAELTDSVPWKPWRAYADQPMDINNATREVVDCLFFLAGICETLGISPNDIVRKFREVLANNYKRLENGYSQDPKKGGDV